MSRQDAALDRADRAASGLRAALAREHGVALLRVRFDADPSARRLRARGEAASARTVERLRAALERDLPGWRVDLTSMRLARGRAWRRLPPGVTPLLRAHPAFAQPTLSTELLPGDGPVEVLALLHGAALVRAMDGTVGWAPHPLGPLAPRPSLGAARGARSALADRLRAHLGVPYALGGTTRRGLDCSGLVQRCLREALGVLTPRHAADQLRFAGPARSPLGAPFDLVFLAGGAEGPRHVGVLLAGAAAPTVVHASSTRGRVVEDPLDRFLAAAPRAEHAPLNQILAAHDRHAGRPRLTLTPGVPTC